ncbi:hypothetical protein GCM10023087_14550 [Microbacterium rhizosphaerae]
MVIVKPRRRKCLAGVMWSGVAAAGVASLFLAPLIQVGWCADAPGSGQSLCSSYQQSLLGVPTNIWIWLATITLIAVSTAIAGRFISRMR